ncbi:MAG: MarR family transcriptional regulator [Alphaproteobacteria bacterium]|nr:MarR family transcriptional regulator [Alphaproteobacteria bacterium]
MTLKTESEIFPLKGVPEKPDIVLERILPYLMNCLTFRLNQLLNQDLRKHGLTISNWRILAVLDVNETASINELVEYAMIEQSTVSRLIMRMEEDGLVRRDRIDEDGRVRSISMTEEGRAKYAIVEQITLSHSERALIGLSGSEKAILEGLISKMRHNIETYPLPKDSA